MVNPLHSQSPTPLAKAKPNSPLQTASGSGHFLSPNFVGPLTESQQKAKTLSDEIGQRYIKAADDAIKKSIIDFLDYEERRSKF